MTTPRHFSARNPRTRPDGHPAYHEVVRELETFARRLAADVLQGPNLAAEIEPGFPVDAGQRFKVIVVMKAHGSRDVLLRADVPLDGYPVTLSFAGQEAEAADGEMLLHQLYGVNPQNEDVQAQLLAVRSLADAARDAS